MSIPKMVLRTCDEIGLNYRSRRHMVRKGAVVKTPGRYLPEGCVWTRLETLEWVPVLGFQTGSVTAIRLGEQRSAHWGFNWSPIGGRLLDLACTKAEAQRVAKRLSRTLDRIFSGVETEDPHVFADTLARYLLKESGRVCYDYDPPRKQISTSDIVYAFVPEFNLV